VTLYSIVLALEFSPIIFQWLNLKAPVKLIRSITIPLMVAAVMLSTLHQSSLGALFLLAPTKLHPLLMTPLGGWFLVELIGFTLLPCFLFAWGVRERNAKLIRVTAVLAVIGIVVGLSFAQQNLKLPADYMFPQSAGSPGTVTFRHQSHVDTDQPNCTVCHPRLFRILEPGMPTTGENVSHTHMEAGHQCGACHNGEAAFSPQDDCMMCHSMQ
jgi:c(7)-type cytochrome triheme protein